MVAVVNGSGLGLFTSRGSSGSAGLGQSRDQVFVNSTTGNLVIQGVDEILTATGADIAVTRTYNSLGITDGDNNDGWRMGLTRSLAVNAGVSIVKTFGDGARVTYNWNGTEYVSTEGEGAHDRIAASGANWVWTDGSERNTETYTSAGVLQSSRDASGNTVSYTVSNGVIVQISVTSPSVANGGDGSTTVINFSYNPGTLDLERVATVRNGVTETLTYYTYDGQHRLSTVTVDLSPANNSTSDNDTLVTTYTYQGTTNLVASITQRKGGSSNVTASVSFTYQLIDGDYRLKTYTDGEGHATTLNYSTPVTTGGSNSTANANSGVLSTTETQNVTNTYNLNSGALSTTDTTSNTYNVNSAALTTNATQTNTYNRNDAALSTTDTTSSTYNVSSAALTTNATQTNTYNRNDAALSTTDTTTTTNTYNLNSGALTTPAGAGAWGTYAAMDAGQTGSTAQTPQVAFDANGNGFALWSRVHNSDNRSDLMVSRYTRATNSWSTPVIIDSPYNTASSTVAAPVKAALAVDASGAALVTWFTMTMAPWGYLQAKRYDTSTNTWGATTSIYNGPVGSVSAAINGTNAVVAFTASTPADLHAARWTGSAWTTTAMESSSTAVTSFAADIDNQGNIGVVFAQGTAINRNRYTASSSTWSGSQSLGTTTSGSVKQVQIRFDGNGNGFASWISDTDLMVARYTRSTNTFATAAAADSLSAAVNTHSLAVDSAGNAILGWTQSDGIAVSAYAKRYTASTSAWSTIAGLESTTVPSATALNSLNVAINGSFAAVSWIQRESYDKVYSVTFNGTTWSTPVAVGNQNNNASVPVIAVDSLGNATTLWQFDGMGILYSNRFTAGSGGGAPYYTVPSGATWQSVANAL
jgi:hypothetical protein